MQLKTSQRKNNQLPQSPNIINYKSFLESLLSKSISLKALQFLQQQMRPHDKYFNIVDIALILQNYLQRQKTYPTKQTEIIPSKISTTSLSPSIQQQKNNPIEKNTFQLKKDETLQFLLQQIRLIFVYWGKTALTYQLINQYVYNIQLRSLYSQDVDEEFMQIGQKRIRIDQNLKLCILPLSDLKVQDSNRRIKEIIFKQNPGGLQLETIFVVTRQNIISLHIRTELIGIATDYARKGSNVDSCWYSFDRQFIKPKKQILFSGGNSIDKSIKKETNTQQKNNKITQLQEIIPSHRLNVLKAQAGNSLIAIICMDQSFIVQPIGSSKLKDQGYIGHLIKDIPPVVAYQESLQNNRQIFKLHCYDDYSWLIISSKFIYYYQLPTPSQNIILYQQNNSLSKEKVFQANPLLLLCQRLPSGCIRAEILTEKHIALMLTSNCVVIIQLIINNKDFNCENKIKNEENHFKIINKIYNDIQFKAMCFNSQSKFLFLSDFGSYIIRLSFNPYHGDIQEQGPTHDRQQNQQINKEMIKNSYSELKASRIKLKDHIILQLDQEQSKNQDNYISVYYIKGAKQKKHNHLLSLYKKQNKSPHTVIIKNQSRQNISMIATNKHYNTLVTYQSESFQRPYLSQFEGDKFKEWSNKNKIKLWDARHMTIYQIFNITIQASTLQLRSNGLYFLTAQKGYVGLYQFNQDKKAIAGNQKQFLDQQCEQSSHQLGDQILLQGGTLFFSSVFTIYNKFNNIRVNRTYLTSFNMQKYPQFLHLQTLPTQIHSMSIKQRIYILQNSRQGVEASQLHIYNRLGLKQQMLIFNNHQDIDVVTGKMRLQNFNQQFKFLKKINHQQFQIVLWNTDSLRFIGLNPQQSLTIVFQFSKRDKTQEQKLKKRQIKSIQINGPKLLVYYQQTITAKATGLSFSTTKQAHRSKNVTQHKKKSIKKVEQQSYHNIAIFNCQSDRLIYQLQRISNRIKILHVYNSIILTKEEDSQNKDYDIISVLDIAEHGQLINKYLFTVKILRQSEKRTTLSSLKQYQVGNISPDKNIIIQQLRQIILKRNIQIEQSKISVNQNNQLLLILIFKIQTQIITLIGNLVLKTDVDFLVYSRNITQELINRDYKVSRIQIGKKTKKNINQYQTSTGRTQNVSDHKELTFEQLSSLSNYTQINMSHLCSLILDRTHKVDIPDITQKILSPNLIGTKKIQDSFKILSFKRQPSFLKLVQENQKKLNAITSSTLKIIQYDDQKLSGVVVVSNRYLRLMILYNISFICSRQQPNQPYRTDISLQKIGALQALSPNQKLIGGQTVRLMQWNSNYKSQVDQMWDQTFSSINHFIKLQKQQKQKIPLSKQTSKQTQAKQLSPLKIRKKQRLRRQLLQTQRLKTEPKSQTPRYTETKAEQADNLSLMFKKWSINQSITKERLLMQNNNKNYSNSIANRQIKLLLKSETNKNQRMEQLIQISQRIIEVSKSNQKSNRKQETSLERFNKLQNINFASKIASNNTLKNYLQQKYRQTTTPTNLSDPTIIIPNQSPLLTRNNTNKSSLLLDYTLKRQQTQESIEIRATNISKLSGYTYATKNMAKREAVESNINKINPNSLQWKLTSKLQELQKRTQSQKKQRSITFICQSPEHKRTQSTRKQFLKSSTENYKTPSNEATSPHKINKSGTAFSIRPFQSPQEITIAQNSLIHNINKDRSRYKTESAEPFNPKTTNLKKKIQTQMLDKSTQSKAVQKLKISEALIKEKFLPQILSNKQKLAVKMKEKRSYVKIIQDHLNESSLLSINNSDQRKKLMNKLLQYQ